MSEYVRSISLHVEVDTNKQTRTLDLSLHDYEPDGMVEAVREFLTEVVGGERPGPTDVPPPRRPVCDCGKFHDARDEQRT